MRFVKKYALGVLERSRCCCTCVAAETALRGNAQKLYSSASLCTHRP